MNNAISPPNSLQLAQEISKNNNKTLRKLFEDKINGSFLIKMKAEVLNRLGVKIFEYYPIQFDDAKIITGNDETLEYDICRIIVGIHRHYSIFLSDEEIRSNQKSAEYQSRLINEVIEKIQLRRFGSAFFRKKQLFLGDEFLYFPVPYELFVMSMKSLFLVSECNNSLFIYYGDIVRHALSALTLMENNLLSDAYPPCRAMIELYLKILMLQKHPEAHESFEQFSGFEIEQSCCSQKYPDGFIQLYNSRKLLSSKSKVNYLHYGWLDDIEQYDTRKTNRYSIYGILDYLTNSIDRENKLDHMAVLYKMCHGYTHGSTVHVRYPLLQYFEISLMLYYVVKPIFTDIHAELEIEMSSEDKLLLNMLECDFKTLDGQYRKRSTDNFELYYRSRKN